MASDVIRNHQMTQGFFYRYDLYEKTGNSFLESIYKSFAEEYKNFFFKEIKEDLK